MQAFSTDEIAAVKLTTAEKLKAAIEAAKTPRAVIEIFMNEEKYSFEDDGVLYKNDGRKAQKADTVFKASFKEWAFLNEINGRFTSNDAIDTALTVIYDKRHEDKYAKISQRLQRYEPQPDEWKKYQAFTGFTDDDLIIERSFIWNVKTCLYNSPQQMQRAPMPIFYSSGQNIGKSTHNKWFYSPVGELAFLTNLGRIDDEFSKSIWGNQLVVDFDEMAGKGDPAKFKTWATTDYFNYRGMRSENNNTVLKTVSPIGSSNKPVKELFPDDTGNTRVWQIQCYPQLWKIVDSDIDPIKLWNDVDVDAECPLYQGDNCARITEIQNETFRRKSNTELFLIEYLPQHFATSGTRFKATALYGEYQQWCINCGENPVRAERFYSNITELTGAVRKAALRKCVGFDGAQAGFDIAGYVEKLQRKQGYNKAESVDAVFNADANTDTSTGIKF